ncbi:MAG: hypothetical protein ACYC3O_13210 [Burkholderiales bacterium]
MNETVLGFQLRLAPQAQQSWNLKRRTTYLLRENIRFPLSVDTAVWSEADDWNLLPIIFADFNSQPNSAPNGLGLYSLRSLETLDQQPELDKPVLISISVIGNVVHELQHRHCIQNLLPIATLVSRGWVCLGYDVADWWLLSGLSNCGYAVEEKKSLSNQFAGDINEYGLFVSGNTAQAFCADCNLRIPEHAPFAIYGIWISAPIKRIKEA